VAGRRDEQRQAWIEGVGIRFVRFVDTDVLRSTDAVVEHLTGFIVELRTQDGDDPAESP
jgi:very-short-patch-repair endonuclease